jgi:antitoxin VapB
MGHQLNIKSDEAYRLAAELAALKGESLTEAVTASLRERLERERRVADKEARAARIEALTRDIPSRLAPGTTSASHDELYGPDGLPT